MLDVYANITDCDDDAKEILGDLLEMRASNPKQRQICDNYLSAISILPGARVMEVGCGTGPICRELARWHGVEEGIRIKLADALEAEACR